MFRFLHNNKMTILYNVRDSHSDITLDDLGSSGVTQVETRGVEPLTS